MLFPLAQIARAYMALMGVGVVMFAAEFAAAPGRKIFRRTRWRLRPVSTGERLLLDSVWRALLGAFIAITGLLIALQTRHPSNIAMEITRLAAGVAILYGAADFVFAACSLGALAAGYSSPLLHRTPIAARSVGEFWGQRWNMIVSAWLRTFVFLPTARVAGVGLGLFCCFIVSGIFHAGPMWVALGRSAALTTMAFFLIQGVFVLAENRLHIRAWPIPIARAWTLLIVLGTSPLFIDPALRLFGL
ncbi:MAG TPA: MBOAT family protein [Verrucomicrobiae bacterium]|nr:MBOAT family protein [Verrucomicrobiae bacterium]